MHFEAVLFDLDGTLLDTIQDLADSMNETLGHFGFPLHKMEQYKYFIGNGMENLVRRSLPETAAQNPVIYSDCLSTMRRIYGAKADKSTRPYPGIPELLDQLSDRRIKMSILSNKPDDLTQKVVVKFLAKWRFEAVMGERPPTPRKPDPTSAIGIAHQLAIHPEKFIYLGDTSTDMETATGAGMYAVGALWGFRDAEELVASGARKLIESPSELLSLLG